MLDAVHQTGGKKWTVAGLAVIAAAALGGCGGTSQAGSVSGAGGSSSGGGGKSHSGSLTIAVYQPFTGANASFGPGVMDECEVVTYAVNRAGGADGHPLTCTPVDTKGDPADAVPVLNKLLATTSNLAFLRGPESPEASAVQPILNGAKVVSLADNGDPAFDHETSPYFYRTNPSDSLAGTSVGLYAATHGFKHAAMVFTSDTGAQTSVPTLRAAYQHLGGKIATYVELTPGQSSYRTEVAQILASHPDAIMTEMDPQTAATFFSEMSQLGKIPPVIVTSRAIELDWIKAVVGAIGPAAYQKDIVTVGPYTPTSGPGFAAWKANFEAAKAAGKLQNPAQNVDVGSPYDRWGYDAMTVAALAISEAKSTSSQDWAKYVALITNGVPGATVVHSYVEGLRALKAGHKIHYIGASGPNHYDRWHNNETEFAAYRYDPATHVADKPVAFMSAKTLTALVNAVGRK